MKMKKGTSKPSKSSTTSASERSMRIKYDAENSCTQESAKSLSSVLNRKTKSSQSFAITKSSKASAPRSKSVKSCFQESLSKYKIDEMSTAHMEESLNRVKESPVQPFTFLSKILDERTSDDHASIGRTKPTEIDLQLAALTRRVNLNKSLLERTNERVKEINFLVERNAMMASRELNCDDDTLGRTKASGDVEVDIESCLNAACPGIMELQRTINQTKDMLSYVRKICNEEMQMSDLPEELSAYANASLKNE